MFDLTAEKFEGVLPKGIKKLFSLKTLPRGLFLQTASVKALLSNRKRKMLVYWTELETSTGAIKAVSEGGGAFAIPLFPLLEKKGASRAILLSKMRIFISLCKKYNAQFFICTLAQKEEQLRNARELIAVGELLGLSENEARERMKTLGKIADGARTGPRERMKTLGRIVGDKE